MKRELGNIEPYIEKGGQIFFALDEDEAVMACLHDCSSRRW